MNYVISDLHGCFAEYQELLEKIRFGSRDGQPLVYEGLGHIAIDCGCVYGGAWPPTAWTMEGRTM